MTPAKALFPAKNGATIFLSGICGTAMASLAGMLKEAGYRVLGSDSAVYPPMSTFLEDLGIEVFEGFDEDNLRNAEPDLVVIGNVLSRGNPEVEYVLDNDLAYISLPEALKDFFIRGRRSIVVTGTHGKTTTTAMLAWMLHSAGRDPSFLLGGIAENFQSSFRLGQGEDFVIEGDEYDTAFFDKGPKFLHYLPRIALIKNIEFDHADIYVDLDAIRLSFRRLINIVPRSGLIVAGTDCPVVRELVREAPCPVASYGLDSGDWRADNPAPTDAGTGFDVVLRNRFWYRFDMPMLGEFNVRNALGAIVAAEELGLAADQIQEALAGFKSVRRRLEVRGEVRGVTVYDDFAHHPTAVRETLGAVRARFPDSRVWAVFEPRSQTARRSVFEADFARSLGLADVSVISGLRTPSGLGPDEVLSPERVVRAIRASGGVAHTFGTAREIVSFVAGEAREGDRIVVMSNGSFDDIHRRLIEALEEAFG